ncbi:phytoene/squalene synthase family protein, partial [Candidatus Bathyarchaeota archaeon]|nr:phytoene/squalene synthase family protein [Candidatus Bathyarchaeota archaeon]
MEISELHKETFKKGSKTYFNSSIFFPEQIRNDVFVLYGFVRIADDFVDAIPPKKEDFHMFVEKYHDAIDGEPCGDQIIDSFIQLIDKRDFDPEWVTAFLESMEMDLYKKNYDT